MWSINKITKLLTHSTLVSTKLVVGVCIFCVLCNVAVLDGGVVFWRNDDLSGRSLGVSEDQIIHAPYETLIDPKEVDFSVDERLSWQSDNNDDNCDDILLYMPYEHSINGQGAQLNGYIKAALLATYLNKALVVLDAEEYQFLPEWNKHIPAPTLYDGGSQFGCPADAFEGEVISSDFPMGLSRLIQNPRWVSRGCGIPTCGGTMNYDSWDSVRKIQKDHVLAHKRLKNIDCVEFDRHIKVTPLGISSLTKMFLGKAGRDLMQAMANRSNQNSRTAAYQWAMRLGANEKEAQAFSETSLTEMWDYAAALINRSGLVRFQPWISRDVQEHIQSMNIPFDRPYDAFHVRRGDKLIAEARSYVREYWSGRGYQGRMPTNYIPFSHYVEKAWGGCTATTNEKRRNLSKMVPARTAYIATDDPATVQREVNSYPRAIRQGASIVDQCNHKVNFVFAPSTEGTAFHINDRRANDDCHQVYKRNIAAIADLVILTRADTFVGDYNSNWGRFIKITRSFLNNDVDETKPMPMTKKLFTAFGPGHPGEPGN